MWEALRLLFDPRGFPPRWQCGQWSDVLGWTHVLADSAIFAAYFAIPTALFYAARRRSDLPFGAIVLLFASFIFACGTTHLLEAVIFWIPVYRLSAVVKVATAAVSIATAVVLIRSMPRIFRIPALERINAQLEQEVLQKEEAQEALREKNEEIENLVHTLSHDLKSPMFTARGYLQILRDDLEAGNAEGTRTALDRLERANRELDARVKAVLQLSQLGRVEVQKNPCDVMDIAEDLGLRMQARLRKAGLELRYAALPRIWADRNQLVRALENLVDNAIRYGHPADPPCVEIVDRSAEGGVELGVRDHGPGLDAPAGGRRGAGTGIGLISVARIMEMHEGEVRRETTPGGGSTVWLYFPDESG